MNRLLIGQSPKKKLDEPIEPVDHPIDRLRKILKFWHNIPKKNKESNKKTVHDSEIGWGRYDRNKPKCSIFELAPMNSNWTEVLGRPHFLSLAWCEQLGNWPWWHSKMNYTLALHWTADEPTQGSKIDQAQKGAMAMPYGKNCVHVTPLR